MNINMLIAFCVAKWQIDVAYTYCCEWDSLVEEITYARESGNSDEAILCGTCDLMS